MTSTYEPGVPHGNYQLTKVCSGRTQGQTPRIAHAVCSGTHHTIHGNIHVHIRTYLPNLSCIALVLAPNSGTSSTPPSYSMPSTAPFLSCSFLYTFCELPPFFERVFFQSYFRLFILFFSFFFLYMIRIFFWRNFFLMLRYFNFKFFTIIRSIFSKKFMILYFQNSNWNKIYLFVSIIFYHLLIFLFILM